MKIEFLVGDNPPLPIIRLFEFDRRAVIALRRACDELANGRSLEFLLHQQDWVESIGSCRFVWCASQEDEGALVPASGEPIRLSLSDEGWAEVGEKLQPFLRRRTGFCWLNDDGEIPVLFSKDGTW